MIKMKILGITGGIGCGKSMVIDLMKELTRSFVIGTDEVAAKLMEQGNPSYVKIVDYFGTDILDTEGNIDRKKLAHHVFKSERELLKLNSFTHPEVRAYVIDLIHKMKEEEQVALENGQTYPYDYIIIETALPYEARLKEYCDEVWAVVASLEIRRDRLMQNRGYSIEKITDIFNKQLSEEDYQLFCDVIIRNDTSKEEIIKQISEILH